MFPFSTSSSSSSCSISSAQRRWNTTTTTTTTFSMSILLLLSLLLLHHPVEITAKLGGEGGRREGERRGGDALFLNRNGIVGDNDMNSMNVNEEKVQEEEEKEVTTSTLLHTYTGMEYSRARTSAAGTGATANLNTNTTANAVRTLGVGYKKKKKKPQPKPRPQYKPAKKPKPLPPKLYRTNNHPEPQRRRKRPIPGAVAVRYYYKKPVDVISVTQVTSKHNGHYGYYYQQQLQQQQQQQQSNNKKQTPKPTPKPVVYKPTPKPKTPEKKPKPQSQKPTREPSYRPTSPYTETKPKPQSPKPTRKPSYRPSISTSKPTNSLPVSMTPKPVLTTTPTTTPTITTTNPPPSPIDNNEPTKNNGDDGDGDSILVDIPITAMNTGILNTLIAALSATDLVPTLWEPNGPYTVFAPTDEAFATSLPKGLLECLLEEENLPILSNILLYHVASGQTLSTDLSNDGMNIDIPTLFEGDTVRIELSNNDDDDGVVVTMINDATVVIPDVLASNGVLHLIDQVLFPPSVDVEAFLDTCGGDNGDSVSDSDSDTGGDSEGSNGSASSSSLSSSDDLSSSSVDIPTTVYNVGGFTTLLAALDATDLVGVLSEPNGPYTVFAPTDEAFAALPKGLVPCLLQEDNLPVLSNILLYHVTSGQLFSTDFITNGSMSIIPTLLEEQNIVVGVNDDDSMIKINDAIIVVPDVLASNGVFHMIDQVLVPSNLDLAAFLETCNTNKGDGNDDGGAVKEDGSKVGVIVIDTDTDTDTDTDIDKSTSTSTSTGENDNGVVPVWSLTASPTGSPTINLPPAARIPPLPEQRPLPDAVTNILAEQLVVQQELVQQEPPSLIQLRIQDFVLQGGEEFVDPTSYQSIALRRVEEQDNVHDMTDLKLIQYYVLYCIYEATNAQPNEYILISGVYDVVLNPFPNPNTDINNTSSTATFSSSSNEVVLDIPGWKTSTGWLDTNTNPCDGRWYGVSCDTTGQETIVGEGEGETTDGNDGGAVVDSGDGVIINIDLFDNGLTGNFPPEICLLASDGYTATGAGALLALDIFNNEYLSNNNDNSWIADLGSQLGYLYFQNTMFGGSLPSKFPSGLIELDIANSLITGPLVGAAFQDLNAMRFLLMDGVQFNSSIPTEIAALPNLEYLFASDSMITGDLSYMESMSMIFEHWVDRNEMLGGTIPNFIGALTTLQSFSIAECNFVGTIPESIGNLELMQQMWFFSNQLSGEIPASLGKLKFMRIFEVEDNQLSDGMPETLCENFAAGMLEVLGADCDNGKVDCPCCTCCTVEDCRESN